MVKREISPAINLNCDEYMSTLSDVSISKIQRIRKEKENNTRAKPSETLIDSSTLLNEEKRRRLIDKIASLVDENLTGRSDMCKQFAKLLTKALQHFGLPAQFIMGECIYYNKEGKSMYKWEHAWVRIKKEVVDGNIDSSIENPCFPKEITPKPYWGLIKETPIDRKFCKNKVQSDFNDQDVEYIWWPDLNIWIETTINS